MICEICGKTIQGKVFNVRVEGANVKVCDKCSRFGTDRESWSKYGKAPIESEGIILPKKPRMISSQTTEEEYALIDDYHILIRDTRESKGWSQKELGMKINEKESIIHHIETGEFTPSDELIKKLERVLNIKLKDKLEVGIDIKSKQSSKETTIGDIIKIKKK